MKQLDLGFILSILIASIVSSFTLWLIEHPVKYFFYFVDVCFIVLLSLEYSNVYDLKIRFDGKYLTYFLLDCLLVASSLCLLFLNLCGIHTVANVVLAIIASSFLPGYVFLRLMSINHLYSPFETLVLSFVLSLSLTCIISSFLVSIAERITIISSLYVLLSFLPIIKNKIRKGLVSKSYSESSSKSPHLYELPKMLLIGLIILFFSVIISILYPQMAWVAGADIADHYSNALLFSRFPHSFSSIYPFFIVFEATIILLSSSSMIIVKTALAYMSIMVILSFYMMANTYLKKIDKRLPITATIAWSLFSGFGWLYFLREKVTEPNLSQMNMIWSVHDKSYADIGSGISTNLWLWFLPMTVSFTIFFTLLYLLKRTDISKRSFVFIFSLNIMALFLVHISELVVFVVLLGVLSLFTTKIKLRLHDALFSTLIGLAGVVLFSKLIPFCNVPNYLTSIMFTATFFAYLLMLLGWKGFPSDKGWKMVVATVAVLLVLFFGGLLAWLSDTVSFSMKYVSEIQFIPWLLYPVRLGIVGAFSLIGVAIVIKKYRRDPIVLFVCLLFSALFVGRIVSIMNIYQSTGYWEWRFLFFIFAAASMLVPITILRASKVFFSESKNKKLFLSTLLFGIIVLGGFSSTFLTFEHNIRCLSSPIPSTEVDALSFLSSLLEENIAPSLLTIPQSSSISRLVPHLYAYSNLLPEIWTSIHPEVPLNIVYNQKFCDTYIYLSEKDLNTVHDRYANGYVSQCLQQYPEVFKNSEVQIYNPLNGVPPTLNSKTTLVMPFSNRLNCNYFSAYDILSLGGFNYTVMLDSDPNILKSEVIIIPFDKSTQNVSEILNHLKAHDKRKIIVLNTEGYGPLSNSYFSGNVKVMLSVNSSASKAYLHPIDNYTSASTDIEEYPLDNNIEFIVDNDLEENSFTTIADDRQTAFWSILFASTDSHITLSDDVTEKVKGTDSLKQIWSISPGDWAKIYHSWNSDQDWSDKDFVSFYWKGSNTGKKIEFGIYAPDARNMHRWIVYDNFTDWRRIIFPLNKSHQGYQVGSPDLSRVRQLEFFINSDEQSTINTTWHLDRALIDVGQWINIRVVMTDKKAFNKLLSFNGLTYIPIPLMINTSKEIPKDSLYFLDGSRADKLYGEEEIAKVSMEEIEGGYQLFLSLKMPPEDGHDSENKGLSQLRFRIDFVAEGFNASRIACIGGDKIKLPVEVEVYPSAAKNDAEPLGWYENDNRKAVFATRKTIGESEIIYINVYPIIKTMLSNEKAERSLYPLLGNILDTAKVNIPKYDRHVISWVMDDAIPLFIFREATLNGNVNVQSTSLVFPHEVNLEGVNVRKDEYELCLSNVTSISIRNGNNINLSAQKMKILEGRGFYSSLIVNNSEIMIRGDDLHLTMNLVNGSIVEISGELETKLSIQGQLQVYVRAPYIQSDGECTFREAYAIHSYLTALRTLGQDLCIKGNIEFNLPLSDVYSFASEFTWSGSIERQPPLLQWSEWKSLIESIPWLIISSLLIVSLLITEHYLDVKIMIRRKHIPKKHKNILSE